MVFLGHNENLYLPQVRATFFLLLFSVISICYCGIVAVTSCLSRP